jgi:hypothetical protein
MCGAPTTDGSILAQYPQQAVPLTLTRPAALLALYQERKVPPVEVLKARIAHAEILRLSAGRTQQLRHLRIDLGERGSPVLSGGR